MTALFIGISKLIDWIGVIPAILVVGLLPLYIFLIYMLGRKPSPFLSRRTAYLFFVSIVLSGLCSALVAISATL